MNARGLLLVPAALAGVALTACSEQETATPDPGNAATSATSSVPAADISTSSAPTSARPSDETATASTSTTAPLTTTAPTTTPATTSPATTVAPGPSGEPTGDAVPVFAGGASRSWLYLGRWDGSAWESSTDDDGEPVDYQLASGGLVAITDLARGTRVGEAGRARETCSDGRLGPVITPNAGAPDATDVGYSAIALPVGDWQLRPRRVVAIDADIAGYGEAGAAFFADDDVAVGEGEVDQIVVTDLDGDGDSESLVVFGDEADEPGVDRGFSGLLLIDTDTGEPTSVAKSASPPPPPPPAPPDAGTGPDSTAGEATTTTTPVVDVDFDTFRVLDVADVNGDGLMEIVVHTSSRDAAGVDVYAYDGADVTATISARCDS